MLVASSGLVLPGVNDDEAIIIKNIKKKELGFCASSFRQTSMSF